MTKQCVCLLFGGRSGEHAVSLMSAASVLDALDRSRYDVVAIGISTTGHWKRFADPQRALAEGIDAVEAPSVALIGDPSLGTLLTLPDGSANSASRALSWDADSPPVFFPLLHGPFGEDGTIQGLLELAGVPYVGSGVAGSAAAMDKAIARTLFRQAGLPVVRDQLVLREHWEREPAAVLRAAEAFGFPVFVKPANLGSSVGVSKARSRTELQTALDLAARFDRRMLIEQAVNAREIEVALLGNLEVAAAGPGEIVPAAEFYSYDDKYVDGNASLLTEAPVSKSVAEQVRAMAVKAFHAIDAAGLARVDFFLERETEKLYVNEINTMPGFTRFSMYPRLFASQGLSYPQLIDRLIELAQQRWRERRRNQIRM